MGLTWTFMVDLCGFGCRWGAGLMGALRVHNPLSVMAGLVPAISIRVAQCPPYRGRRDKPGDDTHQMKSVRMRLGLLVGMRQRAVMLDQVRALVDIELVLAIRAQQLDAGVAQVLVMDVEFL